MQVLQLHGIKTLSVNGRMTTKDRSKVIQDFSSGGKGDPRVLILSSVGITGLNLPMACILVMVVRARRFIYFMSHDSRIFRILYGRLRTIVNCSAGSIECRRKRSCIFIG
jgi:hypothetical protein